MNADAVRAALSQVRYLDWGFNVLTRGDDLFLQVEFIAPDVVTGHPSVQRGRKWLLSQHMVPSEVVTTAFKAVLTAVEHEARESFTYRGEAVMGPHFDVDELVLMLRLGHGVSVREAVSA